MKKLTPVIFGSSGWLSSAAQEYFGSLSHLYNQPLVFGSGLYKKDGRTIFPLSEAADVLKAYSGANQFIGLHFAYLTQEKVQEFGQQKYIEIIQQINQRVTTLIERFDFAALTYASSGAAYLSSGDIEPNDVGKVLYGKLKKRDEEAFSDLCLSKGVKPLIPRIFNLGGKHINKISSYALSDMISQARVGGPILIRSRRKVFRSYCDVADLMRVIHRLSSDVISVNNQHIFDVGGTEVLEMSDLAREICDYFALNDSCIERPELDSLKSSDVYLADNTHFTRLCRELGFEQNSIRGIISNTAEFMNSKTRASK